MNESDSNWQYCSCRIRRSKSNDKKSWKVNRNSIIRTVKSQMHSVSHWTDNISSFFFLLPILFYFSCEPRARNARISWKASGALSFWSAFVNHKSPRHTRSNQWKNIYLQRIITISSQAYCHCGYMCAVLCAPGPGRHGGEWHTDDECHTVKMVVVERHARYNRHTEWCQARMCTICGKCHRWKIVSPQPKSLNHSEVHTTRRNKKWAAQIDKSRFNNYRLWTCSVSRAHSQRKVKTKAEKICWHHVRTKPCTPLRQTTNVWFRVHPATSVHFRKFISRLTVSRLTLYHCVCHLLRSFSFIIFYFAATVRSDSMQELHGHINRKRVDVTGEHLQLAAASAHVQWLTRIFLNCHTPSHQFQCDKLLGASDGLICIRSTAFDEKRLRHERIKW